MMGDAGADRQVRHLSESTVASVRWSAVSTVNGNPFWMLLHV